MTPSTPGTASASRRLASVEDRLAFGRLDLDGGGRRYVGRLGLSDDAQQQLLVDWRAPAASAFYQATAAAPQGVARRRHLATRGRTVDRPRRRAARRRGAAAGGPRRGRRRGRADERAHRAPHRPDARHRRHPAGGAGPRRPLAAGRRPGRPGRPGHRQDRRRAAPRGLPAVHPPRPHRPQRRARRSALRRCSSVTSSRCCRASARPASCCSRPASCSPASRGRRRNGPRWPWSRATCGWRTSSGTPCGAGSGRPRARCPSTSRATACVLRPGVVAEARGRARQGGRPHNEARMTFVRHVLDDLAAQLAAARGLEVDGEDRGDLLAELRSELAVRREVNLLWMPLTAQGLVADLLARADRLAAAADGILSRRGAGAAAAPEGSPLDDRRRAAARRGRRAHRDGRRRPRGGAGPRARRRRASGASRWSSPVACSSSRPATRPR